MEAGLMNSRRREITVAIGYACISLGLSKSSMRGCKLQNASLERLNEIIGSNLQTLSRIMDYNISRGISLFRISSDIIPFGSHPDVQHTWWIDHADTLGKLGEKIKHQGMRVSMHPGQYTVLNAQNPDIAERAVADLEYHARFLDCLDLDTRHKIIIHLGGVYGDPESSLRRFRSNYKRLSGQIKQRLVLENDEKYHIGQVLLLAEDLKIPTVFDVFHHQCHPAPGNTEVCEWLERCDTTWQPADGVQKIHYSQQAEGLRTGAHAFSIQLQAFLDFYDNLPVRPLDIMLECKDKDISAIKCQLATNANAERRLIEEEWARYKYLVMEHSCQQYQAISKLSASSELTARTFYLMVEESLSATPAKEQVLNAAQHVWGYYNKLVTEREKAIWQEKFGQFQRGQIERTRLKEFLYRLAQKYFINSLLESYYFLNLPGRSTNP